MLDKYRDTGRKKPYLIFALTDETFSLVCSPEFPSGVDRKRYYFYLSLLNHSYWIVGSVAGSLLGAALPFDSTGIDFAMTALFVVIFAEQWEKEKQHLPAVCGVVITLLCRMAFGVSGFLIPSMVGITAAMLLARKKLEDTMHD